MNFDFLVDCAHAVCPSNEPENNRKEISSSSLQVIMEVSVIQPFFVVHQGWASCDPPRTVDKLKLECNQLRPGDICFTLASNSALPTGAACGPRLFPEHPQSLTTAKPPAPLHIPISDPHVDVETVTETDTDSGGKFFKKGKRWPWDTCSPPE